jgi:DNA-binding transcriptional MerR regulator
MENLVTIGRFAEAAQVSQKALRLYAANGLLPPARVDGDTGYRYYGVEQLHTARLIGLLRSAGMSLLEIRRLLASRSTEALDLYEKRLEQQLVERCEILEYVRRVMEEEPMFEVKVKQVPAQRYAARTANVRVAQLEPFILETIGELSTEAVAGPPFTIFHGAVTEESDGPVEVGVPRTDGDLELPAGEVAYTTISGTQCDFPEILGAYDAVGRWVQENQREVAGPPREIYLSAPGEPMRFEIAWQLQQ